MILDGKLKPGDKISERELCEQIGVSRTPLREALKVLAFEGLIQLHTNRGATVATLSAKEIDNLFPIIGALEALGAELACARITDSQAAAIRKLHDKMIERAQKKDWLSFSKVNRSIHYALLEASQNPELVNFYQQLEVRIHSIRYQNEESGAELERSIVDHENIIQALEDRDGPRLAALMREHLGHKADAVRKILGISDQESS
ncbi:GntR family transcriptional regulator [Mesorhizobium sp. M7A.F.Ca.US.006.01.1.1]|nr:GntR family transcriptional regulator [Mesorhizobium sp. M7A.F.Ca.US.006.01.1.1]